MTSGVVRVVEILDEVLDLLTDPPSGSNCPPIDPLPCRVGVYPGIEVPWDSCASSCGSGEGQLYANLVGLDVTSEGPCQRITFTANIGILRCASPMADDGTPPSVEALAGDAFQQALDADAIRNALICCDARSEDLRAIVVQTWTALGPDGGCVGGEWTVRGSVDTCC